MRAANRTRRRHHRKYQPAPSNRVHASWVGDYAGAKLKYPLTNWSEGLDFTHHLDPMFWVVQAACSGDTTSAPLQAACSMSLGDLFYASGGIDI